jgi:hypothetical protein
LGWPKASFCRSKKAGWLSHDHAPNALPVIGHARLDSAEDTNLYEMKFVMELFAEGVSVESLENLGEMGQAISVSQGSGPDMKIKNYFDAGMLSVEASSEDCDIGVTRATTGSSSAIFA